MKLFRKPRWRACLRTNGLPVEPALQRDQDSAILRDYKRRVRENIARRKAMPVVHIRHEPDFIPEWLRAG